MKKIKESFKTLVSNTKNEISETKEAAKIIWKAKNKDLTSDEKERVKQQGVDLFKITFLGALFVIPLSGVFIIFLIKLGKKIGVNALPSSFDNKTENEQKEETRLRN